MANILVFATKYRYIITGASLVATFASQIYFFVKQRSEAKEKADLVLKQKCDDFKNKQNAAFEAALETASKYIEDQVTNWSEEIEIKLNIQKPSIPELTNSPSELAEFFRRQLSFQLSYTVTCLIFFRLRLLVVKMLFVCFAATVSNQETLKETTTDWFRKVPQLVRELTSKNFEYIFSNVHSIIQERVQKLMDTKNEKNMDINTIEELDNLMRKTLISVVKDMQLKTSTDLFDDSKFFQSEIDSISFKALIFRPALDLYQSEIHSTIKRLNDLKSRSLANVSNSFTKSCSSSTILLMRTLKEINEDFKKSETDYLKKIFFYKVELSN